MNYQGVEINYEKVKEYFKDPCNFITNEIPKIILERKSKIFSKSTKLYSYEDLIKIKIKTGVYDPASAESGIPYHVLRKNTSTQVPRFWIKIKYKHKLSSKLKATAYFVLPIIDVLLPLDMVYLHDTDIPFRVTQYPITEYMKHEGMDIYTLPYDDDDIVVNCDCILNSYYHCYRDFEETYTKFLHLREKTEHNNAELVKLAEKKEGLLKSLNYQTDALLARIYSVSTAICYQLLDIPISEVIKDIEEKEEEAESRQSKRHKYSKQKFNRKVLERIL